MLSLGESFIGLIPLFSSKFELGFLGFLASRTALMVSSTSQVHHANYRKTPRQLSEVPGHLSKLVKDKEVSSLLSLSYFLFFFFILSSFLHETLFFSFLFLFFS